MEKMIRITLVKPGELVIDEAEKPSPAANEILIKVERCGVCGSDPAIYRGLHPYAKKPLIMGHEFSGTVEQCGANVKQFVRRAPVTVIPHVVCNNCQPCKTETYNFCEEYI